ncbi:MAG: carboxypeptidase M32, partial [Verrucomicrobiota bacterium]
ATVQAESERQRANIREWKREYQRSKCLPESLVKRYAEATVKGKNAWAAAREAGDYSGFAGPLQELIDLNREQAQHWGGEGSDYDSLLDTYERGANTAMIDHVLGDLKKDLVPLVEEAVGREKLDPSLLEGHYPQAKQEAFNREVAESMGFDFGSGRIDTTVHPFCSGMGPMDTRLTTRYDEKDFRSSLYGVLHEAGHGLYDQGLPDDDYGTPVGNAVSLGVHESQSRLWENHIGRSRAFWEKWLPRAAEYFPHLGGLTVDQMYRAVNQAERTFIRVEADEVTYDLHVILRYEIEKALFEEGLSVADLPDAWNAKYAELFGIAVDSDANGCLQDIHWSMGAFGYFPTYSLGNLNASHLFESALSNDTSLKNDVESGDFSGVLAWMRERIHQPGTVYAPDELITLAAGSPVSSAAHLKHLKNRYLN